MMTRAPSRGGRCISDDDAKGPRVTQAAIERSRRDVRGPVPEVPRGPAVRTPAEKTGRFPCSNRPVVPEEVILSDGDVPPVERSGGFVDAIPPLEARQRQDLKQALDAVKPALGVGAEGRCSSFTPAA